MVTSKQLADEFYRYYVGVYPKAANNFKITELTIQAFKEAGVSVPQIKTLFNRCFIKQVIEPKDAPEFFWEHSLLKPDTFYSHPRLQIVSPATTIELVKGQKIIKCAPVWYIEMRIQFTIEDAAEYLLSKTELPEDKKTICKKLRWVYNELSELCTRSRAYVKPIDLLLSSMDMTEKEEYHIASAIKLYDIALSIYQELNTKIQYASRLGQTKIIWRTDAFHSEYAAGTPEWNALYQHNLYLLYDR